MTAILRLAPVQRISREELEAATLHVESVLAEHANDITDGASASANFEDCSIEIDLQLDGSSVGELHEKLAQVIARLERHGDLPLQPQPMMTGTIVVPTFALRSTATQVMLPRDLVSA